MSELDVAAMGPEELWDECCEFLWIRGDLVRTRSQARYFAWNGRSPHTSWVLEGEPWRHTAELTQLRVRKMWARDTSTGEWDEYPWHRCEPDAPGAVPYWEVTIP